MQALTNSGHKSSSLPYSFLLISPVHSSTQLQYNNFNPRGKGGGDGSWHEHGLLYRLHKAITISACSLSG
jgi:hypothetical protein